MAMPTNIGIIDCMLGIPDAEDRAEWFAPFRPLIKDKQTLGQFAMPAQYMFKDIPQSGKQDDYLAWTVAQMDKHNVEKALVGWNENETSYRAKELYPDRFFFDLPVNPNNGTEEVRRIKRIHAEVGLSAVSVFPSGTLPQVAINHKYMWPIYSACEELGLPILLNVGIPGPRIPMETQKVEHLDEVCWFFPELKVVMRHGAEPWEALAVKLMLKWPNLYYSTSAFAPKHYPKAIIDYANTRGADKVIYAGYFPMGLSLDRIMSDMQNVPFKDEVWPKFLRENAMKVFGL
ncbi:MULTISPECIES: amidohydrolase family protein [Novosphingobium]|uniref:Amidohydrolase family protein n=1 Tax=Novosphingobium jiangmenense TaxID=2791981 RepID=A0ABS0HC75_9SPHN|nr:MULTISPECIES: amidohydrolase family protein [Novosphingobium]MBF9149860.1 amidohydrolase family protein [Novosphingobium jiangmenense]QOV95987.1 amidohydrolase family protein [Novosphingobium sp. ES2-1]